MKKLKLTKGEMAAMRGAEQRMAGWQGVIELAGRGIVRERQAHDSIMKEVRARLGVEEFVAFPDTGEVIALPAVGDMSQELRDAMVVIRRKGGGGR